MTTPYDDIRREVFGQQPELAFQGHLARAGGGRRLQDYYRQRSSDFLNQFQGQVGRDLLEGRPLDQVTRAEDFFGRMNFQDQFASLAPSQRGFFSAQSAPKARWLVGF